MQQNVSYNFKGLTLVKITESLEHLGPHCSIDIPKEYPFAQETGMFFIAGQEGVFFISEGSVRVGTCSELENNYEVFNKLKEEEAQRRKDFLNSLRAHPGFGPVLQLAGFDVRKVSDKVPYVGYLRVHPISLLYEDHEWLYDPHLVNKKVNGVYPHSGDQ